MNAREEVIAAVKRVQYPSLNDLIQVNSDEYPAIRYLIKVITGKSTKAKLSQNNNSLSFIDETGASLLELQKMPSGKWNGNSELACNLDALLIAVRIHEVESFEWVYFPPEMRKQLVAEKADTAGISPSDIKRLMNIWIA